MYIILTRLDVRWSERLLHSKNQGFWDGGNFRRVCPKTGRKKLKTNSKCGVFRRFEPWHALYPAGVADRRQMLRMRHNGRAKRQEQPEDLRFGPNGKLHIIILCPDFRLEADPVLWWERLKLPDAYLVYRPFRIYCFRKWAKQETTYFRRRTQKCQRKESA